MKVTLTQTGGYLKKLVNEVTMVQRSLFPIRYYMLDRVTGELQISNKPGGTVKHRFSSEEITYVKVRDLFDMCK